MAEDLLHFIHENDSHFDAKKITVMEEVTEALRNMSVTSRSKQSSLASFFQPLSRAEYEKQLFGKRHGPFAIIL